ncbi:MAG: glycosyltransferase family 4 protein [Actinomycetota bacterium]
MNIGFDVSRYFDRSGGIGIYSANLLKNLLKVDKKNSYTAYSYFYECFPKKFKDKKIISEFRQYSKKVQFPQLHSPASFLKKRWENSSIKNKEKMLGNPDIVHSTAFMVPEFFNARLVVTMHDLSFLVFPQYHTRENFNLVLRNLIYLNSRPGMVICVSEQTKRDTMKYFHVPGEKLKVIYHGVDKSFKKDISKDEINRVLKKYNINSSYLLCVSSIEPRKNFERIIEAFSQIIKTGKYKALKLICVGGKGWKNTAIYKKVKEKNMEEKVRFLGFIEEGDLIPIYKGAKLFLYPSLYEGFGLPVLEAMAARVPVITSNVSSLPEVAGDAAVMVNPYEEKEIYDAIAGLLENENRIKDLIARGTDNIKRFSWEKTARQTLKVYETI